MAQSLPSPWQTQDIGNVGIAGSATYTNPVFTVTGSGADIWDTADAFRYVYQTAGVNCTITARVVSMSNSDPWAKAGVMIRDTLAANAANAMVAVTPGNGVSFQNRSSTGGYCGFNNISGLSAPYWVRLVRSANVFAAYCSPDGVTWTSMGSAVVNMSGSAYVGLAVTAHNNGSTCTARFDNVTVTQTSAPIPVVSWQTNSDGLTFQMNPGTLKLQVFSPRVVRVAYSLSNSVPTNSLAVIAASTNSGWSVSSSASEVRITTSALQARVDRATGGVGFYDTNGTALLGEPNGGGKNLMPTSVGGINMWRSQQQFLISSNEALYGLGQHGSGLMNYRGSSVHLQQQNPTESAIPVLVSSRGYGLLWDNPAICDVSAGQIDPTSLIWTSEAADAEDYYFMYGPALDDVIGNYRNLTGTPPLFAKWQWGFWQCKNHYQSQQELTNVANTYRNLNIPIDSVIQDWFYWSPNPWGSHVFDSSRYPNVTNLMTMLHATNVHMIISVWARFDTNIPNALQLAAVNGLYTNSISSGFEYYDPFNSAARQVYWSQISQRLFSTGIDGWWLDASEPELTFGWGEFRNYTTAAGPGAKVFNAFPLMHTTAVYQGHRAANSNKRSFILTRSAYAGQQRNGAVTWSGDIGSSWTDFANQIPAGLNFSISGVPYWNTDTGGFWDGSPSDTNYAQIFTRWFQFSTFCPMLRIHGNNDKAMWNFPASTQPILISFDKLRYHLLPYIYSTAWQVTSAGYTMMRPLVMDFQADTNVFGIKDQFMFGPALMPCPVITSNATTRSVYLPSGTTWYDFWTGATNAGGQTVSAAAPIDKLPLFVRAGSILPYGPDIQYATQTNDPIELRVYRGANCSFTLYEDENDNYNYESGSYATIPFTWNEASQTLTIGARQGSFPGMLTNRTFRIVCVGSGYGTGIASTLAANSVVAYNGNALSVSPTNPPPPVPTGLQAAAVSDSQINLAWNALTNAASYNVKRSLTDGGTYATIASCVTATNYNDASLAAGTMYYYVVNAVIGTNETANSAQATATTQSGSYGSLIHRYSFLETNGATVADSVGGPVWNGTLPSGGTLSGGQLTLSSGSQQYASLPSGIVGSLSNCTIIAWVNLASISDWSRIFDFGNGMTTNLFLTPQCGGSGKLRFAITTNGGGAEQQINCSSTLSTGTWHQVAVSLSGTTGILYLDGAAVGTNSGMTLNPAVLGNTANNYLGKSQYPDPYLDGSLDEFRIYNVGLSSAEIAATVALGSSQLLSTNAPLMGVALTGTNLTLSWPLANAGFILQSRTNLFLGNWVNVTWPASQIVGTNIQITLPPTNAGSVFYRLVK